MTNRIALLGLLLSLAGCPPPGAPQTASAPPVPAASPAASLTDAPAPLPMDDADSLVPQSKPEEPVAKVPKEELALLGLFDGMDGGIGIDEVDPNVGTARVKDTPRVRKPEPDPPPTTPARRPRPKRKPIKPVKEEDIYGKIATICKNGEEIDIRPSIVSGEWTLFEFYADW